MTTRTSVVRLSVAFALAGSCLAGQWDKRTVVTWSEPTLVGSTTLPPGRYVLRLEDVPSSRHVIRFLNEREDKVVTTVLALPNLRLQPGGNTEFRWWETPRGNPRALRAWFYPGDSFGHELVYPKGLAAGIARGAGVPVLTAPSLAEAELSTTPVTETIASGEEKPLEEFFVTKAPSAPAEPVQIARAETAPEPEPQQNAVTPELPATASPFFAIGLGGMFAMAIGFAMRQMSRS